ncbi:MAG: hypothetical protein A2033_03625 [Bacteroidetes bacterium GWA2_31_9]|nr:MAG: hypothetical protein A2033_03625 [Bacteroidetes bacterium GWA2_31_9]
MLKYFYLITIVFVFFSTFVFANINSSEVKELSTDSAIVKVDSNVHNSEVESSQDEEHEKGGMEPLFFIIIALTLGAATRHFLKKSPIPYTVLLLLIGLIIGIVSRLGAFSYYALTLDEAIKWAGHIDPHVILFVFLPTLIFEAAFAMDIHTFKKTATNSLILALPGILVAIFLTGFLMIGINYYGIGLFGWDLNIALMFGAIVSATDPVAVVALLKELGVSKKLSTLIDGESILNDGTAIVLFMVFFLGITGVVLESSPFVEFLRVAIGGLLIGIIIAVITIAWVKKVFNDAMVETSLIVIAAYLTFYVAEHFLHVSGVLGLFALGLAMASVGRTRISPEVEHFLHEFWELAAFIANTLIFVIVGVVIANQAVFTANDFIILGIVYVGIHIIRAIMIAMFYPLMKKFGYGITPKESYILWYGALRGAVGLALALVVAGVDDKYLSPEIKNQFVFLTAGIVTLTLLINATTIKWLVNKLGMTKISPAKALMIIGSNEYLKQSTENALERLKTDRFLSNADWKAVEKYLPEESHIHYDKTLKIDTVAEMRKRVLEKEKSSYWYQFKEGMLSSSAVRTLSGSIDEMMDSEGIMSLAHRKDLEDLMKTPSFYKILKPIPLLNTIGQRFFFDRLAKGYDCARGFVEAQDEVLKLVESMYRSYAGDKENTDHLTKIEEEINENKIEGLTFLRNLRKNYSDIYNAITTKHAIRTLLNYELKTVERLVKNGRIDSGEAEKLTEHIEERMKKLMDSSIKVKVLETSELIAEVEWFSDLPSNVKTNLNKIIQKKHYNVGETLIKQDSKEDGLFIISRGTVKITIGNDAIDTFGQGSMVGEMAILTNNPRTATVIVESPVTALWISNQNILNLIKESPIIEEKLWDLASKRYAENFLRTIEPFNIWKPKQFNRWISAGKSIKINSKSLEEFSNNYCILVNGEIETKSGDTIKSPAIISPENAVVKSEIRMFIGEKA